LKKEKKLNNYIKTKCRIVSKQRDLYKVKIDSQIKDARVKGSFLHKAEMSSDFPYVGDWVTVRVYEDSVIIEEVLERKTQISRKVAGVITEEQILVANIDYVAIILGLDGGRNYSDRLLERFLAVAWDSGATPLLILNKADLNIKADLVKLQAETIAPGVNIIISSAKDGSGISTIFDYLANGKVAAFIGPSGVGKSALTNALLNKEVQKTGEQRTNDKRGKHTTSSSIMFELANGGYIVDSPGLKEIQLWADEDDLNNVFDEIAAVADNCKFTDCNHLNEPGCAVQAALESGKISPERYDSYLSLKNEIAYLERRKNEKGRHTERLHDKEFTKYIKTVQSKKIKY
jgi:ribosome biogenesis GTPase / thiamine phosphate phosphatase